MKKRTFTLLLAALMLSQLLVSCSNNSSETESTPPSAKDTTPTETNTEVDTSDMTEIEKRQLIPDDLPAVTFNGNEFRVLTTSDGYGDKTYEIMSEELTGDNCNDAVFKRNSAIE